MIRIKEFSTFIFRCWCRLGLFFQPTNGKGWWSMITSLWGQPTTPQPCGCSLGVVDQLSNSSKATSFNNSQQKRIDASKISGMPRQLFKMARRMPLVVPCMAVTCSCWAMPSFVPLIERDGGRCWKPKKLVTWQTTTGRWSASFAHLDCKNLSLWCRCWCCCCCCCRRRQPLFEAATIVPIHLLLAKSLHLHKYWYWKGGSGFDPSNSRERHQTNRT